MQKLQNGGTYIKFTHLSDYEILFTFDAVLVAASEKYMLKVNCHHVLNPQLL